LKKEEKSTMKRQEMEKIIKSELEYIPNGSSGSTQNKLRFFYNGFRRKGMVKGMTREDSLIEAIHRVKEDYPSFDPEFDEEFFKTHEKTTGVRQIFGRLLKRF
jgi:hypothetical protein